MLPWVCKYDAEVMAFASHPCKLPFQGLSLSSLIGDFQQTLVHTAQGVEHAGIANKC